MIRRSILFFLLFLFTAVSGFTQAGTLRDYVGLISIRYHPEVIAYMSKFREAFEKRGYTNAAKSIDNYLKGLSGSGFVHVAPDGTCYVLTNEHVVAQSESLSITFEKLDGAKTTYDRLKVSFVDEEKDLALLVFDAGLKPFTRGLNFGTKLPDEGSDVFAAGYPGLGNTAIWQFSKGTVSNAAARLPKNEDSDETIGPYIQHTAQIDPGNSGGPLLGEDKNAPAGYTVVGINTLSAFLRQAANYAIPAEQVTAFINAALSKDPVNERELVTKKVNDFIGGLRGEDEVYGHIAKFLSNNCTASNAEYAILELLDRGSRPVLEDIDNTFISDPVEGMNAAVAWYIENSMRSRSKPIDISLDSIEPGDSGGFSVVFKVNDKTVKSEWIKEYGVYRMDSYGDVVTGDKVLLEKKQKERAMITDYSLAITAGYAHVFDYGPALNASLLFSHPFTYGIDLFYGFGDKEYFQLGMNIGYAHPIRMSSFALTPFGELGMSYYSSKASKYEGSGWDEPSGFGFAIGANLKGGVRFTLAAVPGLFGRVFYSHNFIFMDDHNESIKNHGIVGIGIGYGR